MQKNFKRRNLKNAVMTQSRKANKHKRVVKMRELRKSADGK